MRCNVTSKAGMYRDLASGRFGSTIPQFFSIADWRGSPDSKRYEWWGVRSSTVSAHPLCKMYVHRSDVADYARQHFCDGVNISMMVDAVTGVRAWLEAWIDDLDGLCVQGIENPKIADGWTWRNSMRDPSRLQSWRLTQARMVLRRHLNENSYDDLMELLEMYSQGHVVELSALESCIGCYPGRNAVVWEVRLY